MKCKCIIIGKYINKIVGVLLCKRITLDYARVNANRIAPACVYKSPSCRFNAEHIILNLSLILYTYYTSIYI